MTKVVSLKDCTNGFWIFKSTYGCDIKEEFTCDLCGRSEVIEHFLGVYTGPIPRSYLFQIAQMMEIECGEYHKARKLVCCIHKESEIKEFSNKVVESLG